MPENGSQRPQPTTPPGQRSLREAARRDPPHETAAPVAMRQHQHRPDKPKPPVVRTESRIRACGHFDDFEIFADKQDRYREERRKKFESKACQACRDEKNAATIARQQAAAAESRKRKPPRQRVHPESRHGRLPDKARFVGEFDASKQEWSVSMQVPLEGDPIVSQVFNAKGSGLFPTLARLDGMYREWASKRPTENGVDHA